VLLHWEEVIRVSLQIVSVIGNATKDAELKSSKEGVSYVTFRLAASGSNENTTFYNVVIFGKYGEVLQEHIMRGRKIFVSGKLQVSEKGYVSVVADHIELLARPKGKKETEEKSSAESTDAAKA
jgi:single-strand DNA-binding protein